jgi:hypothetical protein
MFQDYPFVLTGPEKTCWEKMLVELSLKRNDPRLEGKRQKCQIVPALV